MIDTNLKSLDKDNQFPPNHLLVRNAKYQLNMSRYNGTYGENRYLKILDSAGNEKQLPYKMLKINKFKLYTNKMDSLIFNRDPVIKTGCSETDKKVEQLVTATNWWNGIRRAVRNMEILGDGAIKTHKNGCSSFNPKFGYKVVDETDSSKVLAYVLYEYLDKCIRFEIHFDGHIYEVVRAYNGNSLGGAIRHKYKNRTIPVAGLWYDTGVDIPLVQWLSLDSLGDYGISPYDDFANLVHEIERRQTLELKVIDAHSEPIVVVGMGTLRENELTGKVETDVLGSILEVAPGGVVPQYITWDSKTDASNKMIDRLFSEIYELSELGKTFMTGEYTGNVSDETLSSIVKSATDRANRHLWDIYPEIVKSLYCLCRLNNIDILLSDINIMFQTGQSDSIGEISKVVTERVNSGTLSIKTALQQFDGMSEEQALKEIETIKEERKWLNG